MFDVFPPVALLAAANDVDRQSCGRGYDFCSIRHKRTLTSTFDQNDPLFAAKIRPIRGKM
jgi:hypothetical protein